MEYTFSDHLHNYAVWTAARAVQREFTNTFNIKSAIEATGLRNLISWNNDEMTADLFDAFHRETANMMIDFFNDIEVRASYGQAAKIIAIYLKTSVIIRDSGLGNISKIAHPPVDNILLTQLHRQYPYLVDAGVKWTQLDESNYFRLIHNLRQLNFEYFWEIEKYWTPAQFE